jgi:hypothetical protein
MSQDVQLTTADLMGNWHALEFRRGNDSPDASILSMARPSSQTPSSAVFKGASA